MAKTNYSPTFPMYPGDAAAVTTSDTVNFREPSVIYVGGAGNVRDNRFDGLPHLSWPCGFQRPCRLTALFPNKFHAIEHDQNRLWRRKPAAFA